MAIKLKDIRVPLKKLLLDPDNYRVATKTSEHKSNIQEIHSCQDEVFQTLKKQKLADLKDSITKNGFLTVDRIVVTKLEDENYLVIEGNRRVAALKSLISDYEKGYLEETNIADLIEKSQAISAVLVDGTAEEIRDYSNALMGIRHVSGAKKWHGWQSAKLVNSMHENGHTLTDIGLMLGITAIDAGRRMRGYRAFQQLENDPNWGGKKETHHYGLLLEFLVSNNNAKHWLNWSDKSKSFENTKHLDRVFKAISRKDDGTYEVRNTDDAREFIKRLDTLTGQQRIMEVDNYRSIELDDIQSENSTLHLILALLRTVSQEQVNLPEERVFLEEIKQLVIKLSEATDD